VLDTVGNTGSHPARSPQEGMSKAHIRAGNLLVAVIGEPDTVTGMLLAGIGNLDSQRRSNFLIVEQSMLTPFRFIFALTFL